MLSSAHVNIYFNFDIGLTFVIWGWMVIWLIIYYIHNLYSCFVYCIIDFYYIYFWIVYTLVYINTWRLSYNLLDVDLISIWWPQSRPKRTLNVVSSFYKLCSLFNRHIKMVHLLKKLVKNYDSIDFYTQVKP